MGENPAVTIGLGVHRGKFYIHLNATNTLSNSMSLSSLGRIEDELGRLSNNMAFVLSFLTESVQAGRVGGHKPPKILGASEIEHGQNRIEGR